VLVLLRDVGLRDGRGLAAAASLTAIIEVALQLRALQLLLGGLERLLAKPGDRQGKRKPYCNRDDKCPVGPLSS
jgi:hypothetical protein